MIDNNLIFSKNNIHSVELNLLDGQIELLLRSLELYGFNLEYMLNSNETSNELKQEKKALLRYTNDTITEDFENNFKVI